MLIAAAGRHLARVAGGPRNFLRLAVDLVEVDEGVALRAAGQLDRLGVRADRCVGKADTVAAVSASRPGLAGGLGLFEVRAEQGSVLHLGRADGVLGDLRCFDRVPRNLAFIDAVLGQVDGCIGDASERDEQRDVGDYVATQMGADPAGDTGLPLPMALA